jgi:hypothetical protein
MKKLLVLVALVAGFTASASHLLGGMVTVAQTSYDSTSVGVYLIADPQGITPNTINVEKWEMNSVGWYVQNGYVTLAKSATVSHQGKDVITYISNYLDLDSNKYRFIYKNCCWGMLNNSTNSFSSDFIISADYWHIPNNSLPYAENPLWVNVQKDTLNNMKPVWGIYNCFLSQFDNDSVNVTQTDLHSGYANGVFVPQVHTALNMHVSNDSISWTPDTINGNPIMLGNYGTGFEINEYRNGNKIGIQRIQWTFRVVNSTIGIKEDIVYRDTQYSVYDWNGRYMGEHINWAELKGLYVIKYNNGKVEKIFAQ